MFLHQATITRNFKRAFVNITVIFLLIWMSCNQFNLLAPSLEVFNYTPNIDFYKLQESIRQGDYNVLPPRLIPKFDTLLVDEELCSDPLDMLLLVKSTHRNINQREAIRQTWGHPSCNTDHFSSRVAFIFGTLADFNKTQSANNLQAALEWEQSQYHDIIQFDFEDSYFNNTFKFSSALEFVASECQSSRFVVIVDDDFLVHPANLRKLLNRVTHQTYPTYVAGRVFHNSMPRRFPLSKWYVSYDNYPFRVYPSFPTGGTLVISMPMVRLLALLYPRTQPLYIDDVLLGIVLYKLGISPVHLDGVLLNSFWFQTSDSDFISIHGYDLPHKLRRVWSQLNLQSLCRNTT